MERNDLAHTQFILNNIFPEKALKRKKNEMIVNNLIIKWFENNQPHFEIRKNKQILFENDKLKKLYFELSNVEP